MHSVFGLLKRDALRAIDHFIGHFQSAASRQVVHEAAIIGGVSHEGCVDLESGKIQLTFVCFGFLAHTRPNIGIHRVGFFHRFDGVALLRDVG